MTEYDYSPDAIERHNAKQAQIADWVHRTHQHPPANPFRPVSTARSDAYYHHSPSQLYTYPASYSSPYGVIPSQYSGSSGYGHRHRHRRHSESGSLYSNPYYATNAAAPYVPMNMGYGPMLQRSFSTPSSIAMMSTPGMVPGTTWVGQQPYGYGGYYPPMQPVVYPTPYYAAGYPTYPQSFLPLTTSHSHHHSSHPYSSSHRRHSRSRSDSELYMPTMYPYPSAANGLQVVQSPANQQVYVPTSGGGYVVLPPGQQAVMPPMANYPYTSTSPYILGYDSDSEDSRRSL